MLEHFAEDFVDRLEKMRESIPKFADAKATRIYLENFRHSKRAMLMNQCRAKTVSEREQFAYGHPEYIAVLDGLREAVKQEEQLKWQLERMKMDLSLWQSVNANNRYLQDKV